MFIENAVIFSLSSYIYNKRGKLQSNVPLTSSLHTLEKTLSEVLAP